MVLPFEYSDIKEQIVMY